ncbi:zinc knuckle transcription factor [Penicillium chermesinum]|nr:zinc knuckle transcription factor [Penicillium chermesinum]
MERLKDAGLPYDRYVPKCRNCDKMGHIAKHCKEERIEVTHTEIRCANCDELGHRVRDCPCLARADLGAVTVAGHFAKDCPNVEARPPRTCRNCGTTSCGIATSLVLSPAWFAVTVTRGHFSRECPEPKNWSKVKCNRCGEMGHTVKRCPQPEDVGAASRSVTHEGFSKSDNGDDFDITHQLTDLTW